MLIFGLMSSGIFALKGERYAAEGMDYYNRGQYNRAIDEFLLADKSAEGSVPLYHYWLSRLHIATADISNAHHWMDKYLQSGDQTYAKEIKGYKEILAHQDKIFESIRLSNMPSYINSRNSDYAAQIDPGGKYLYFTSVRPAKEEKENIWRAEVFKSGYGRPEVMSTWSTDANEALGSFSNDGRTAYLFGNYNKGQIDGDIYVSNYDQKWSKPRALAEVNSPAVDTHPFVFNDSLMFFTSSRDGGYGGTDIWVSIKKGDMWQEPFNAGPNINTIKNEQTPSLVHLKQEIVKDDKTLHYEEYALFFASDGHAGFGGYDLFKAVHKGPSWDSWFLPQNLGLPINSIRDDRYFNLQQDANQVFISSDRQASDFEKILSLYADFTIPGYKVDIDDEGEKQYIPIKPGFISDDGRILDHPEFITFVGKLTDDKNQPISADITFSGYPNEKLYKKVVTTDKDGNYELKLPWADPYNVVINPDGYMLHQQEIPAPKDDKPVRLDFVIKALELDKIFVFNNIQFDFDKATLKKESHEILNDVVITMLNNPTISLEISGHTCNIGAAEYNQRLSERRAKAVVDYLVSKGVDSSRLEYKGFGESQPLNRNKTIAERALNRRVEMKVIK